MPPVPPKKRACDAKMDGEREPLASPATAPEMGMSDSLQLDRDKVCIPPPSPSLTRNDRIGTRKYKVLHSEFITQTSPLPRDKLTAHPREPSMLPKPPYDDDNVSVSTDASGMSDLSCETVSETGSAKGRKKKKSGAARRKRKQERIDASLAQFDAERAYRGAEMALYAVSSQVEHLQRKILAMVLRGSSERG